MSIEKRVNVAVTGATGAVGEALVEILQERNFPVGELALLASERSAGKRVQFHGKSVQIQRLDEFDFSNTQIGLFSAGGSVSAEYAPKAAAQGCIVVDNTSHFRNEDDIPLVVSEVNPECVADYAPRNIIANPNCSTIQMLVALKPIYDAVGITRINVATYQAVSGAGASGIEELAGQTAKLLNGKPIESGKMPAQIAFNAIPQIDTFQDNGYTREEMKMAWETCKILKDDAIAVNATCVRIPVFYGHSEAVHIETREPISVERARSLLALAPGLTLLSDRELATPVEHGAGTDSVFVSRVREDISHPNGLNLWVVADNVRKGAALNSVQIAEILLSHI